MLIQRTTKRTVSQNKTLRNATTDLQLSALRYIPTTPAAIAFGSLYLVTLGAFVILSFRRYGRYMLVLMLSTEIYAAGLFMRLCTQLH